jgi:hypothetical protein
LEKIMNPLVIIAVIVVIFAILAIYYAVKFPSGKLFPTRRSKLLRKVGPLMTAQLEDITVRFLTRAGGEPRVMLNASYRYNVKEASFTITLPTESTKLPAAAISNAVTATEFDREIPEQLVLQDGQTLQTRAEIRAYYLGKLRERSPTVEVLFDQKNPAVSTVRNWK